ncbi:MAG: SlyX family protein [Steroidobacteraceae bacterium]
MQDATAELLELKIAYLERANLELSDVLYRQQQELDLLRQQFRDLVSRFESLKAEPDQYTAEQERPPHY